MSQSHGNTPAAWTAVVVAMVGFVVAGIGLMLTPISMTVFWIGVVVGVVALPVFAAMNKMGMGEGH
ncbi:MAG: HGxxPAAW family protein [Nocardioides sp.]